MFNGVFSFILKCRHLQLTPTFAKVQGNFHNQQQRFQAVKSILNSNLREHWTKLRSHQIVHSQLKLDIILKYEGGVFKLLHNMTFKTLEQERISSLETKNTKIKNLLNKSKPNMQNNYEVPVINLTNTNITAKEMSHLKNGLHHSFVDKNKNIKQRLAAEFENLTHTVQASVPDEEKENFYHFLRSNTNRFSQNIFHTPDDTWKSLYKLSHNTDIVVLQGDKDSSVVIMYKQQYIHKLESMIEDGVSDGKYQPTSDNTLQDLKSFQDFLYRNIRPLKSEVLPYDKIRPTSSQPGYLYATAKTHKFSNYKDITADKIKLRPIVSACGTFYYETAKSLASYLSPLATNEHTINNTLDFADLLKDKTLEQRFNVFYLPHIYNIT